MNAESDIEIADDASGMGDLGNSLYQHNGTSWQPLTLTERGSLLVKGSQDWEEKTPGTSGYYLRSTGVSSEPEYNEAGDPSGAGPFPTFVSYVHDRWVMLSGLGMGHDLSTVWQSAADDVVIWPWIPSADVTLQSVGLTVYSAVASSNAKIVVLSALADTNKPGTLLHVSSNMSTGSTGAKSTSVSWSFTKGTIYWVGVRTSAAIQLVVTSTPASAYGMGCAAMPTAVGQYGAPYLYDSVAYATGLTTWPTTLTYPADGALALPIIWGKIYDP